MKHYLATLIPALALAASPALAQGGFLGVELANSQHDGQAGAPGARIVRVEERSAASIMGLRDGDLVTAVDGLAIADAAALSALIRARLPGDIVELEIQRDGAAQKLLGVLARRPGAFATVPPPPQAPQDWQEFEFPFADLPQRDWQPQLQNLQLQLRSLDLNQDWLHGLQEELRQMDLDLQRNGQGFSFRFSGEPDQIFMHPGMPLKAGKDTSIQLRYPADTPPAEQERLRKEAIEKYGEEVQVEFAGTGTAVIIQRQSSSTSEKAPAADGNREF